MINYVKDWGGFEKFVAELHKTGNVIVEHNAHVRGKSNCVHQIDVLLKHITDIYQHQILVECKFWNSSVQKEQVMSLSEKVKDTNSAKGVIFTTHGFQEGAHNYAAHNGIDLYLVREMSDEEWGRPGKVVTLNLQMIQPTVYNFQFPKECLTWVIDTTKFDPKLKLDLNDGVNYSRTPIVEKGPKITENYFEERIVNCVSKAMNMVMSNSFTINNGKEGDSYMSIGLNMPFDPPIKIQVQGAIIEVPGVKCDLGLKVSQSKIIVDRGSNYYFAVALENVINGQVSLSSRKQGDEHSKVITLESCKPQLDESQVLQNNSIIKIHLSGFFDPKEIEGKVPVKTSVDIFKIVPEGIKFEPN